MKRIFKISKKKKKKTTKTTKHLLNFDLQLIEQRQHVSLNVEGSLFELVQPNKTKKWEKKTFLFLIWINSHMFQRCYLCL